MGYVVPLLLVGHVLVVDGRDEDRAKHDIRFIDALVHAAEGSPYVAS
ncbi:hypothetical protein ACFW1A_32445 [Kitasatospora sp. NPDC058965]